MDACLCLLALFAHWGVLGAGTLAACGGERLLRRHLLVAPALGLAVLQVLLFTASRLGWSVHQVAPGLGWLTLVPTSLLAARHARRCDLLPMLRGAGLLVAASLLAGWPLLAYSWDWLSFCNDDMVNYVLAAHRFASHGLYEPPDPVRYAANLDATQGFWFMHAVDGARCGAELLLAYSASLWHRNGFEIFMPVILSFHLALLCAATSLAGRRAEPQRASVLIVLGSSSLLTFGVLYQLIAQTLGLALWCALGDLALRPRGWQRGSAPLSSTRAEGLLSGLLLSGLVIGYTEVVPLFVLSAILMGALVAVEQRRRLRLWLARAGAASAVAVTLLGTTTPRFLDYLLVQAFKGSQHGSEEVVMFPAFLLPTGLPKALGLLGVQSHPKPPWSDGCILAGIGFLALIAAAAARDSARLRPGGVSTLLLLAVGGAFFVRGNGFALYKLAMYSQPFLLVTLVTALLPEPGQRPRVQAALPPPARRSHFLPAWAALLLLLCSLNLMAQQAYVRSSQGLPSAQGAAFVEIAGATPQHLTSTLKALTKDLGSTWVLADSSNVVLSKILSLYAQGRTYYPASFSAYHSYAPQNSERLSQRWHAWGASPQLKAQSQAVLQAVLPQLRQAAFDLHSAQDPTLRNPFTMVLPPFAPHQDCAGVLLTESSRMSILNRLRKPPESEACVHAEQVPPPGVARNHLYLVPSELGTHNYHTHRVATAIFQPEPDPYRPGRSMAGLGRHALFWVHRPSDRVRLCLELTCTLQKGRGAKLPPACAIGAERVPLPLVGRGSARVFSPAFTPQTVLGWPFVALDLGEAGLPFPTSRSGLMRLYGHAIELDWRRLVAFGRSISLLSDADYQAQPVPRGIKLPDDLLLPTLEYSGIGEDGWIGEAAAARLASAASTRSLRVRGVVPQVRDPQHAATLTLAVDGVTVLQRKLALGSFDLCAPVHLPPGPHDVLLRLDRLQELPAPDERLVGARLDALGFEDTASPLASPPAGHLLRSKRSPHAPHLGWLRTAPTLWDRAHVFAARRGAGE